MKGLFSAPKCGAVERKMTDINRTHENFSKEDRELLLNQFEKSGLSSTEFAREHNIQNTTFLNWLRVRNNPESLGKRYSPTERKKILEAYSLTDMTAQDFCKAWGLSPATLWKWQSRYRENGSEGLLDSPRRSDDRRLGMKVPVAVQNEILDIKKKEPSYGLKKIKNWMFRFRGVRVSTGTIRKTVRSEGLELATQKKKRRRKAPAKIKRFERAKPMQLWQSDITQFNVGPSSMRVYLTVFMDDHSRYIVGWRLLSKQTADLVLDAFKDSVVRFGKPQEVLTDQGRQYFAWRGKSELEKLLESEGIKHVVSRAHHPQTLGKCERFWETVYNEFWTRAKPQDLEEARLRLKYFIDHYNHQRPHQGLDGMTPADRFFGVAEEVRSIIEKTVTENSLRLALGELPKAPAFLIGQIGDQRIAFHGSSGKFILTNENLNGEENGDIKSSTEDRISVRGYAINSHSSAADGAGSGKEEARSQAGATERGAMATSELSGDTSSGFMGPSERRRSWTSEGNGCENNGNMGGINIEGTGGGGFESSSDQILADEQSGACGYDGGITYAAAYAHEASGEWDDRERRDQFTS